jgi:hypothetical protein
VQIAAAVAADLEALTLALQEPDLEHTDLEQLLRDLARNARHAVPSYQGMSLGVASPVGAFSVTAMEGDITADEVVTSLHLPGAESGGTVTFYAGQAGAFVELAADLSQILRLPTQGIVLDKHLAIPVVPMGDATGWPHWRSSTRASAFSSSTDSARRKPCASCTSARQRDAAVVDIAAELVAAPGRERGSSDG